MKLCEQMLLYGISESERNYKELLDPVRLSRKFVYILLLQNVKILLHFVFTTKCKIQKGLASDMTSS